ncbi:MAG TPA: EAL domain-containing protein [Allosphingosinicella sp.]|nr:EAL domain-containing protein [Allosphingosinicella sp.]
MQIAPPRRRKKSPEPAVIPAGLAPAARRLPMAEEIVERARQDYLDALPIAAAIVCVSAAGDPYIDMANETFHQVTNWGGHEGKWVSQVAFLSRGSIGKALSAFLATDDKVVQFESHDGEEIGGRHFSVQLSRLKANAFATSRCLISLIDKTAQVETEKSLRSEMLRDSLTGLPNRMAFNERVEAILHGPEFSEGSHAVVVVDMMRFSRVNECMGAIAGDELLITFARRLFSALRAGDVLARTGGDEFGILMRLGNGLEDALQLADRVKAILAAPFRLSELEIRVDCSIGIALVSGSVELAEEILRNAQFALKRSKQTGDTQIYEPKQASAARRRFSIETELRRAIEGDQLKLAFQPLIDLANGKVSGFEALARWDHEERGAIAPDEFIPVAEESGLIVSLGRWALDAAARTLSDWDRQAGRELPISVAVNLSAIQIARDDVARGVAGALRSSGLAGGRLTLELTESAIIQDPVRATRVLEALKGLDAKVAMDDFGTGYTSLSYLQRLPIDMLKIDRSFVTGMLDDKDAVAIIRAVLSLADALGMATTAEGIESEELARALTRLGCTHGQGFLFSEPLPPDRAFGYWLSRNS